MPYKNTIRHYASGLYYHIYNRGVEKRTIFYDDKDYIKFLSTIKYYLTPKDQDLKKAIKETIFRRSKLEDKELELLCYCLMPNHFHFLIKQNTQNGITRFMRRLSNTYVKYFNKKYDRVGTLFQGKFKAVLVETNEYLLHLSRYIHRNPLELGIDQIVNYSYSSYPNYINKTHTPWINTQFILDFYKYPETIITEKPSTYRDFVEIYQLEISNKIKNLTLD